MDSSVQVWRQETAHSESSGTAGLQYESSLLSLSRWIVFALLLLPSLMTARQLEMDNPYTVEAAFLRNFAHYVTWPREAFSENPLQWHICILGRDPFGSILDEIVAVRAEQGRSFVIFRADKLEDLPQCQIIYIAYTNVQLRRATLAVLKDKPVLTVSEAKDFLTEGGVLRFQVSDRVGMSINLDQARRSMLQIQTKMLEVSNEILENGVVRRMR